jgi:hypothetical protein
MERKERNGERGKEKKERKGEERRERKGDEWRREESNLCKLPFFRRLVSHIGSRTNIPLSIRHTKKYMLITAQVKEQEKSKRK